jgi:hypothetical protein
MPLAVGTDHSWSSVGMSRGVRVDMRSYNRILGLRGDVIVVQAGCLLRDVIKVLGQLGRCLASGTNSQTFPPVPTFRWTTQFSLGCHLLFLFIFLFIFFFFFAFFFSTHSPGPDSWGCHLHRKPRLVATFRHIV